MEVEYNKVKSSASVFKKLRSYLIIKRGKSSKPGPSRVAPTGCFSVYVGPEKQRFVIKTEYANHPLFKMLLEDAESEYGFANDGPLHLPCDVNLFCRALAEMDNDVQGYVDDCDHPCVSGYDSCSCSCSPFSPALGLGRCGRGRGAYDRLTPTRMIRINHF